MLRKEAKITRRKTGAMKVLGETGEEHQWHLTMMMVESGVVEVLEAARAASKVETGEVLQFKATTMMEENGVE